MMEYTFNFQLKGGEPCKLTIEADSYELAFQKICSIPLQTCDVCQGEGGNVCESNKEWRECGNCSGRGQVGWHVWRNKGYIDYIPYPLSEEEQDEEYWDEMHRLKYKQCVEDQ